MYIDQHLHWGPQIKHINNKLAKNTGIITKLKYYVNLHAMKQLYQGHPTTVFWEMI